MRKPKILIYDIETTPNLAYVWGKYQQDVIKFEEEWKLLSFAYKWLGESKTVAVGTNSVTEEALVLRLHQLFSEADIIIAHNGDRFDQKMVNAKFLEYGLLPPSYYKSIDTLKVAKRYFRLNSNKLDDLGTILRVGRKAQTGGFDTWLGCMQGNKTAWRQMLKYNKQDVVLLEKVYLKLRPWIDNHPGVNLYGRPESCPKCGGGPLHQRGTRKTTKTGSYARYQCQDCGGWSTGRKVERVDNLVVN